MCDFNRKNPFLLLFFMLLMSSCGGVPGTGIVNETKHRYTDAAGHPGPLSLGKRYYRVRRGDTLYAIAKRAGMDFKKVAKWNQITPPYKIIVGQNLKLFNKKNIKKQELKAIKKASSQVVNKPGKPLQNKSGHKKLKVFWQWPIQGVIERTFAGAASKGIDIVAYKRQSIRAAASGEVVYSGSGLIGYGNLIIIQHNQRFLSAYGNNSQLLVKEGDSVNKGQKIAEIRPRNGHKQSLHFEIRDNGKPVNPLHFLPRL